MTRSNQGQTLIRLGHGKYLQSCYQGFNAFPSTTRSALSIDTQIPDLPIRSYVSRALILRV